MQSTRSHRRVGSGSLIALLFLASSSIVSAQDLNGRVQVYGYELDDGSVEMRATNNHSIEVYIWVDAPELINMDSDISLPYRGGLDPGETDAVLFVLRPTRNGGRRGYSISYSYARGNPETAFHDGMLYLFPFEHGTKYRLSQGFHGRFTHYGENEYAVDFEMAIGTPVYAARGGVVAEVKENSRTGGPSVAYGEHTNYILIQHKDGSFGNYAHLDTDGAIVGPGDHVETGDLIGYSGNTGRSSGPHLHFDVRLPTFDGAMASIPFQFRGAESADGSPERLDPVEGGFYYAYHPGGPEFEVVLGSAVSMEDYADYREEVDDSVEIDVRVEQIDLTFLVFVQNGYGEETEVEIDFTLRGLSSDAGRSVSVSVPAQSEVLATILRPVDGATSIQYGYSVRYLR